MLRQAAFLCGIFFLWPIGGPRPPIPPPPHPSPLSTPMLHCPRTKRLRMKTRHLDFLSLSAAYYRCLGIPSLHCLLPQPGRTFLALPTIAAWAYLPCIAYYRCLGVPSLHCLLPQPGRTFLALPTTAAWAYLPCIAYYRCLGVPSLHCLLPQPGRTFLALPTTAAWAYLPCIAYYRCLSVPSLQSCWLLCRVKPL